MSRPDRDDYYWYRPKNGDHNDWQPVQVAEGQVTFIGTPDPIPLEDLDDGTFVKMGRPIPFMGTISNEGLRPPDEETFM